MPFDADAYRKSLEPPSIVIDGETYTGRLLSFDEYVRFLELVAPFEEGQVEPGQIPAFVRTLCELVDLPADKILALPVPAVYAAIADFLPALVRQPRGTGAASPEPAA